MSFIKSFISSISMFTVIPMPRVEWDEENLRYLLACFPAAGLFIALPVYLLFVAEKRLHVYIPDNVFYMISAIIPAIMTGGIHIDGFMDVCDALGSHRGREEELRIMKDSRVGASAVMGVVIYYIAYITALSLIGSRRQVLFIGMGFVLSRALSALALLTMPSAREGGMAGGFVKGAAKLPSVVMLMLWVFLCAFYGFYLYGIWGAAVVAAGLVVFFAYEGFAVNHYGGLTGDLSGWFLCLFELIFTALTGIIGYFWFV